MNETIPPDRHPGMAPAQNNARKPATVKTQLQITIPAFHHDLIYSVYKPPPQGQRLASEHLLHLQIVSQFS